MELLKIELYKIKKSSLLWVAAIMPVAAVLIAVKLISNLGFDIVEPKYMSFEILSFSSSTYLVMFLPLLCIYVACNITKIENENSGWKQLMLLPIKRSSIYFNKYKVMLLTLIVSIASFTVCITLGAIYLSGKLNFDYKLLLYAVEIFITTLPIIIVLFIIGRHFTSIIPVISVGIGFLITNTFIVQSRFWIFAPWTYSMALVVGELQLKEKVIALSVSLALSISMFLVDYLIFKNSDIKER